MQFTTPIDIKPFDFSVGYSTPGIFAGSCFAQNIAGKMQRVKMPVSVNPFGILFNPASIMAMLDRLNEGYVYTEDDLIYNDGLWSSLEHHGSFSSENPAEALENINSSVRTGQKALAEAGYVTLTLGTAWVFEYKKTGKIVGNCHKLPSGQFTRKMLSVDEIVNTFDSSLNTYLANKKVIFTVSPVRHIKDGFPPNQLSKSTLIVAVHELMRKYKNCRYFPAYEIMMDELRDYRFYDSDMIHPSSVAVEYIWEKFRDAAMEPSAVELAKQIEQIVAATEHRPFNPQSEAYKAFCEKMLAQIEVLALKYPDIDFNREADYFKRTV